MTSDRPTRGTLATWTGHFVVAGMSIVFWLMHAFVDMIDLCRRAPVRRGLAAKRYLRLKAGVLHGIISFQWSWFWTIDREPLGRVIRYIFMLEIADIASRILCAPAGKTILVLQLAHIGDFLVSLPSLIALHKKYEEKMLLVVSPWSRELASKALPGCRMAVHETAWGSVTRSAHKIGMLGELASIRRLTRNGAVQLIDFGPPWPVDLLFNVMGQPARYVGQAKPYWRQFDYRGELNVVELQQNAITTAGEILQQAGSTLPKQWSRSTGCEAFIDSLTADIGWPEDGVRFDCYVCMGVGAGWDGKRWPVERFAQLAMELEKRHALPVVFLGSGSERELAEQVSASLKAGSYLNLCDRTSLVQAIGLIKHAKLFIGNDSGLLHMAGLVGTPSIAFFMPGNAKYWNPAGAQHLALEAGGTCPCSRYPVGACRQPDDPCMARVSCFDAESALERLLSVNGSDHG